MSYLGGYSATDTEYNLRASGDSSVIASFSHDLQLLTVSSLMIETIKNNRLQATDENFDYVYDADAEKAEPWCSWDINKIVAELEKSKRAVNARKYEAGVLEAVFHTLIVDRDPIRGKRRQELKLTKRKGKIWPEPLNDYLAHVRLWTQERSLIVSTSGYIGLAPSSTLPGDKICILHGFHAPVILRPHLHGRHTLVGDAYVHGLMDGEAVAPGKMTRSKKEEFVVQ